MNFFEAILMGIVQGITEFLPVSSSGHLAVIGRLLNIQEEAGLSFEVLLHVGTLAAVCLAFREDIRRMALELIRMINDLLSLSRIDRGVSNMDLEFVNLNDFVNHILNRFDMIVKTDKNKDKKKKYTIKRELGNQALWVEIDTDKMMQVIDNIMNNAIKYSPNGGVITVRLTQNKNHVILSISDQGLGIPRKDLGKIFDRFYRVDKARSRAQGGTGLGLAIAKEIVEAHHGRIWADSSEGKGSTFYISLPYKPMTEEDDWDEV